MLPEQIFLFLEESDVRDVREDPADVRMRMTKHRSGKSRRNQQMSGMTRRAKYI